MTNNDELWSIRLPSGEIRKGTIDQLDEAFQSGAIAGTTPVLAPGETVWTTLGALAGLDDHGAHAHAAHGPATTHAPVSQAPVSEVIPAATSLRPVTSDFDDEDFAPKARGRGKLIAAGGAAFAAVVAVVGIAIATAGTPAPTGPAAAAAPPAAAPAPYVTPPSSLTIPADNGLPQPRFTEEQRKQLEAAQKARPGRAHAGAQSGGGSSRPIQTADPIAGKDRKGKCVCAATDPLCGC